jgi:putative membrane protein
MSKTVERILIICVDRDDDIGDKANIQTPIIGRDANLHAATALVLQDPEESDANAIFGALQTYDSLSTELHDADYEIVTISGSRRGGFTADKQLHDQLVDVLRQFPADNAILVTDGFSDEEVIPIIQSQVPLMSVKRIVVRHSETIEESWALFSRYLRRILEDPYYSRWVLGVPGLLLLIMGVMWQYIEFVNPGYILAVIIGILLMMKGFAVDKVISEFIYPSPLNLIRLFTTAIAFIIGGLAISQTLEILFEDVGPIDVWLPNLALVLGISLKFSVDLLVISSSIFIGGLGVYFYFVRDSRMLWSVVGLVVAVLMRIIALHVSEILLLPQSPVPSVYWIELSAIIALSIATTVIVIFVTLRQGRRFDEYFMNMEI